MQGIAEVMINFIILVFTQIKTFLDILLMIQLFKSATPRVQIALKSFFFAMLIYTAGVAQPADMKALQSAASGLQLRSIGPAVMGGRIADIAVSPHDRSTWYVAVGSGGLWKTTNRGISWQPVFDGQQSYSIGCVAIDPHNPAVIWVGTGENVSGRHVGWGDGIYKSADGGKSWQNMGLKQSEHIGKILIDPTDSDVVYVAADGPLWSSGGDRGLYKSIDGGKSWDKILHIDDNTGVTDIEFKPNDRAVIYAAAYQRRRKVWSLLSGGPQSGIYKSTDGGDSWRKMSTGLPKEDKGKIGLAVTPADQERVYATIEADDKEKGFYRSDDAGESWQKQNSYISGGTGPHYYQELEASPVDPDLVYQMDVFVQVTRDGGRTFTNLGTAREKHSDNHAMWIDPDDGRHLLVGTDAGLYETFDEGSTYRHFPNLPVSQFYKLALDNSLPFYNVVGGAQDLGTLIGPSRTMNTEGVRNQDWYVPLGADGYDCTFDTEDPNIVYMEIQQGLLHRYDRRMEEGLNIQPQGGPGDPPDRWNWDSPLTISPHKSSRLYFGSQRLWKSDDRGNSWVPVSGDLTTNTIRYELPMTDRVWSVDDLHDTGAMSKYATLTAVAESPFTEGLLYTGSDDGLIHVSEDGGKNWRKSANPPKLPALSFINDIEASVHQDQTLFVAADAHKEGDYSPYLYMSADRGRSWQSIAGDLPYGTLIWSVKQDPLKPELLFTGTEKGIYFSPNKGVNWIKLSAGVPTIPFRDIELHPRDHDLVGASFGRGFYVLDDYTPLRTMSDVVKGEKNHLFEVRDAWWYVPYEPMQAKGQPTLGTTSYVADNPDFGAVFTYYLADVPSTPKAERKKKEKELREKNADIPFPGWDQMADEAKVGEPQVMFLVSSADGEAVRWIKGKSSKGLHRVNWDLRFSPPEPVSLSQPEFKPPWASDPQGPLAAPGLYQVQMYILHEGTLNIQGAAQTFEVKAVQNGTEGIDFGAVVEFQKKTSDLSKVAAGANRRLGEVRNGIKHIQAALVESPQIGSDFFSRLEQLQDQLEDLNKRLTGDRIRQSKNESANPSIMERIGQVKYGHWGTRQMPTETQKSAIAIAEKDFEYFQTDLNLYLDKFYQYESDLEKAGAPYTPGRRMK